MSRHFITDQQTLSDLNLFGRSGMESILTLFNRTVTVKGAEVLEELLRYPLSDTNAINERSGIIRQFTASRFIFPFRSELFDVAEYYLSNTDERSRLSDREQGWSNRLANMFAADNEYKKIQKGIMALLEIWQVAWELVQGFKAGTAWEGERQAIAQLLGDQEMQLLLQTNYGKSITHEEIIKLDSLLRFRQRGLVLKLLQHLYYLDVCTAIAGVATEKKWSFANALPELPLTIKIEDVRHPALPDATPNSIAITANNNVIFLTGANMAGKSTLMKTLGIVMFLAHAGFPVPARKMEFSVLEGIYTSINLADNLGMGASHFYAEVLRVKKVARELSRGKHLFVLFDELFRGTNVKDAGEGTIAITKAFAGKRNAVFIISTHIVEAGAVLKEQCSNISFQYLPTRMNGNQPVYTYRLTEGITDDRHGMVIIQNEGILEILEKGQVKNSLL